MTDKIISLPCVHEAYYLARKTLRRADATPEQIAAALDVLQHSSDWMDRQLCRDMRWADTRRLSDADLIAGGADMQPASTGLIRDAISLLLIIALVVAFYVVTP